MRLAEWALLFLPADFRREYRDQVVADDFRDSSQLARFFELAATGLSLRLESLQRDYRYGLRTLRADPQYAVVALFAISLAVGANLAIASIVRGILLQPLPYAQSQRLLFVQETNDGRGLAYPAANELMRRLRSLADFTLLKSDSQTLLGEGPAKQLIGSIVSPNYFTFLGIRPVLGSLLGPDVSPINSVVISSDLWTTQFGHSPSIVGRYVHLGSKSLKVAGVVPRDFLNPTPYGLTKSSYWLPINRTATETSSFGDFEYFAIARGRRDIATSRLSTTVKSELATIVDEHRNISSPHCCIATIGLREAIVGPVQPILWSLYAAVSIVLLIACANLINMQLARQSRLAGQIAIRAALGASPARLARESTTATWILAILGTAIGIGIAEVAAWLLNAIGWQPVTSWRGVALDWGVLLYAFVLVPVIALISGTIPTLLQTRRRNNTFYNSSRISDHSSAGRVRSVFVTLQIACAVMLVVSSALVLRNLGGLTNMHLGFNPSRVYEFDLPDFPAARYPNAAAQLRFVEQLVQGLQRKPGIVKAALASQLPFFCCDETDIVDNKSKVGPTRVLYSAVSPDFFESLEIPLISGRGFGEADDSNSQFVAMVDTNLAKRMYGTINVLGRTFTPAIDGPSRTRTIIGIVGSTEPDFGKEDAGTVYLPVRQSPDLSHIVIKADDHSQNVDALVSTAFVEIDPNMPAPSIISYNTVFNDHAKRLNTLGALFGAFALVGLVLALSGTYAVTAYSVAQRTREFAIRRALGATGWRIVTGVLLTAIQQGLFGAALGALAFFALSRSPLYDSLLNDIPTDLGTIFAVAAVFVALTTFSALAPALLATSVQPANALRSE